MTQKAIYTFAKWQVKEGQLQLVLDLLTELAKKSASERGNLFYKINQSLSDTHTLILFEGYKDETSLDEHRSSEHFRNLVIKKIIPLLEKREVELTHEILLN
ncbi:MAG: antibiotic biosynthesis monooxygenase [Rhizobacter sp.]|nr:antibiotic biosynthesis monooxygenase [Ferruginibacter sp.]